MIAAASHLLRLSRAGFVFAREGVFALVDTRPLPLPARAAIAVARLLERPSTKSGESRLAAALSKLGPTYVKLGQFLATRPDVVGTTIARDLESLQDKMAPFPQGEAEAAVVAALGKPLVRGLCELRSGGRRGIDCASASRGDRHRRRAQAGRGQSSPSRHRAAIQVRSGRFLLCGTQGGGFLRGSAQAAADRGRVDARPLGRDRNGFPAGSRRGFRNGGEHARGRRLPRAHRRLGSHRARGAHAGMDRRRPPERPRRA